MLRVLKIITKLCDEMDRQDGEEVEIVSVSIEIVKTALHSYVEQMCIICLKAACRKFQTASTKCGILIVIFATLS